MNKALLGAPLGLIMVVAMVLGSGAADEQQPTVGTPAACGNGPGVPSELVPAILAAAKTSKISAPVLAAQLDTESQWNARAVSPKGAKGLAQFLPTTWETLMPGKDPFDPRAAIEGQGLYMGRILERVTGLAQRGLVRGAPLDLALASYNAGEGTVQLYRGVPPFPETQAYIPKIKNLAETKYANLGTGAPTPCAGAGGGSVSGVDDYPWATQAHCQVGPGGIYQGCPAGAASPLGFYYRECVDFAAWRVNQELGTPKAPWALLNSTFRPDGQNLGSALTWRQGWQAKGWPTGTRPVPGAVVFYAPHAGGAGPVGHVAIVRSVNADGTFVEEGYNGLSYPRDHIYYTRVVDSTAPTAFLYLPNKTPGATL